MLKIGVIGVGSIATHRHIPEYEENPHTELTAFADIVKSRADEQVELYGGTSYESYEALLNDESIDAVSICTPNYLHAEITIAALNKGKHVLCEKPMATSLDDAERMIEAAESNGKKLMIGHNQRFTAAHIEGRQYIAAGKLGKIYSFKTTFGHPGPEGWSVDGPDSWFFDKKRAFIGAMGDLGVHKADLMRFLLGESFVEVAALIETSSKENADVDDNAALILKSESGIIGTLSASWSYNGEEDNSTVIYGEKGIMKLNADPDYSFIFISSDGEVEKRQLGKIQTNDDEGQTNTDTINQFVDAVINDKTPPVDGHEGMKALEVIMKALDSAENKTIEKI